MIFTESGTFIPAWNNFSAYSAIFAAGLQLPTYKRFSLNINVLDNYLNNPAVGFKNNSLQFVTGVALHPEIATCVKRAVSMRMIETALVL